MFRNNETLTTSHKIWQIKVCNLLRSMPQKGIFCTDSSIDCIQKPRLSDMLQHNMLIISCNVSKSAFD